MAKCCVPNSSPNVTECRCCAPSAQSGKAGEPGYVNGFDADAGMQGDQRVAWLGAVESGVASTCERCLRAVALRVLNHAFWTREVRPLSRSAISRLERRPNSSSSRTWSTTVLMADSQSFGSRRKRRESEEGGALVDECGGLVSARLTAHGVYHCTRLMSHMHFCSGASFPEFQIRNCHTFAVCVLIIQLACAAAQNNTSCK